VWQYAPKMRLSNLQYITDDTGKKLSVVLPFKEYERLVGLEEADVKREFELYKGIWETATRVTSSTTEMVNHPAYLHIISLGKVVVPLLLNDMQLTSNHWFEALHKITGANPVPEEHRGKIQLMISDWLKWARDNNRSQNNRTILLRSKLQ
jgi:hypothetical protein